MAEIMNYHIKMEQMIAKMQEEMGDKIPKLLLHSCCAPCSSYVLEYLSRYFSVTVLYYNPNIYEEREYHKRGDELKRLIEEMSFDHPVSLVEEDYEPSVYSDAIRGMEHLGEGSERCYACYRLRMERAAVYARENRFDYFTTTLSVSPHKNAAWINEIGEVLEEILGISYLYADFKKKDGYKRSIELSDEHHLYRQDFCGCAASKEAAEHRALCRKEC